MRRNGRRDRGENYERTCGAIDAEYSYCNNATYDYGLDKSNWEFGSAHLLTITYKANSEQQNLLCARVSPAQSEHAESHDCYWFNKVINKSEPQDN